MSFLVELEGIEPSSKQGNHMLSTCLSLPSIFECKQDQSHQFTPYPLSFVRVARRNSNYSRFYCATKPNASEQELLSDVSFLPLWQK